MTTISAEERLLLTLAQMCAVVCVRWLYGLVRHTLHERQLRKARAAYVRDLAHYPNIIEHMGREEYIAAWMSNHGLKMVAHPKPSRKVRA